MPRDLLLEIGAEEIPAGYIPPAVEALVSSIERSLAEERLAFRDVAPYATPRRLAVIVRGIADRQEDRERDVLGPPAKIAFDENGEPTKAAAGFAASQGVGIEDLETRETEKGAYLFARVTDRGRSAAEVLADVIPGVIASLAFPKTMWWGPAERFARPIRWLVAMLGEDVISLEYAGVRSRAETRGHRIWSPGPHAIKGAGDYLDTLRKHFVVADIEERKAAIRAEAEARAEECGGRLVADDELLDEVAFLVESPTVFLGTFDDRFLDLPRDVVVAAMKGHQRYFAIESEEGNLLPRFICVANVPTHDVDAIRGGNERVLVSRLDDAEFYWIADTKETLEDKVEALRNVVWLEGLGTLYEKTERLERLAARIAEELGVHEPETAVRAARLAKADLVTEMVRDGKEFTELQGIMGREYAIVSREPRGVAQAIYEHYMPRFAADRLPGSEAGTILAIADRLDSIVGCFSAGLVPSGSQDPYALRRLAIGVVRMIVEKQLGLATVQAVRWAADGFDLGPDRADDVTGQVVDFMRQRARTIFIDSGYAYDLVDAVLEACLDDLAGVRPRLEALSHFREAEDFEGLVIGARRVMNILRGQSPRDGGAPLAEPSSLALETARKDAAERVEHALAQGDFDGAVRELLHLRRPIDTFFDDVMVMVEDDATRDARLALLARVRDLFFGIADFAKVVLEGEERT